ncbi:YciI family protein [Acidocella aminolytica]|uniref:hypothetical protein n=1 Tax=Acidocella aminolytica TaxID=33998 RepID=UPI00130D4B5C|nr:hypothetical protein [Acidocella aminolytica]
MKHIEYMSGFFASGELVMGGPFLDDSGGMAIFNTATKSKRERLRTPIQPSKAGY